MNVESLGLLWLIFIAVLALRILLGIRSIPPNERGRIIRLGRPTRVVGPGRIFLLPFLDRLERVSIEPFSVSLPPLSAITRDEIPIQLVASMDATVENPTRALSRARDWRIALVSELQNLMKDRLEALEFDHLPNEFPAWVESIQNELNTRAAEMGLRITGLKISNLSPRTRPSS